MAICRWALQRRIGLGTGLFIASVNSASDSEHAQTYDDHIMFSDRAKLERTLSYIAIVAAMIGVWWHRCRAAPP